MTVIEFEQNYWRYYRILEDKFRNTLSYVELSQNNFSTYSNEYAHLIQTTGAELDSFFKIYCGLAATDKKTIADYAVVVLSDWPDINNQIVRAENIALQPFNGWDVARAKQSLSWWEAFDNLKHSRVANIKQASLENAINILAALYMLEMKFHKKLADTTYTPDVINDKSRIFMLNNWQTRYISLEGAVFETSDEIDAVLNDGGAEN